MPFGILVVHRILAIQVRQSEFVIYSTAPVLRGGAFVALMSSHAPADVRDGYHRALSAAREIAAMRSTPAIAAAREKAIRVIEKLRGLRLSRAAERWWKWRSRERSPTM